MTDPSDRLTPADPGDLLAALAFALLFQGRKRVRKTDELLSAIVAKRLVEHLERSGFVVMTKPPIGESASAYSGTNETTFPTADCRNRSQFE